MVTNFIVPAPKYKNKLLSINNIHRLHWATIQKLKDNFKYQVKSWLLEEQSNIKYKALEISIQLHRYSNRKLDAVNNAYIAKWFEDCLIELGYIEDDKNNRIILYPTLNNSYRCSKNEDLYEITIKEIKCLN